MSFSSRLIRQQDRKGVLLFYLKDQQFHVFDEIVLGDEAQSLQIVGNTLIAQFKKGYVLYDLRLSKVLHASPSEQPILSSVGSIEQDELFLLAQPNTCYRRNLATNAVPDGYSTDRFWVQTPNGVRFQFRSLVPVPDANVK